MEKEIDMKDSENNGVTDTSQGEDPNEHIKDYLKNYFEQKTEPKFAVMLTGEWGCGKTWLMDEVMKTYATEQYNNEMERTVTAKEKKEKATLWDKIKNFCRNEEVNKEIDENAEIEKQESALFMKLSLYGMKDTSEIDQAILQKTHPFLKSMPVAITGSLLRAVSIGFHGANLTFDSKQIKLEDCFSTNSNKIMVFDDIERCRIPHEELFGFINKFVEHEGSKVVILSNEKELFPNSEDAKGNPKRYKEKIVGATLTLEAKKEDAYKVFKEDAYKVFTNSLDDEKAKKEKKEKISNIAIDLLHEYKDNVLKVFDIAGDNNLRNLRQAILALPYFLRNFPAGMLEDLKKELYSFSGLHGQRLDTASIIENYFHLSLEERKGAVNADNYIDAQTVFILKKMSYSNFLQMEENKKRAEIQDTINARRNATFSESDLTCAEFFNAVVLHKSIKAELQLIHGHITQRFKAYQEEQNTDIWQLTEGINKLTEQEIEEKYKRLSSNFYSRLKIIEIIEITEIKSLFETFGIVYHFSKELHIRKSNKEITSSSRTSSEMRLDYMHNPNNFLRAAKRMLDRRLTKGDKVKADLPYFNGNKTLTTFYENGSDIMIQLKDSYSKKLKEARDKQLKKEFHKLVYNTILQLDSKKENRREIEELGETLNENFSDEPLLSSLDEKTKASLFQGIISFSADKVKEFTHVLKNRYTSADSGYMNIPVELNTEKDFISSFVTEIEKQEQDSSNVSSAKIIIYRECLNDLKKIESAFDAAEESLSVKSE